MKRFRFILLLGGVSVVLILALSFFVSCSKREKISEAGGKAPGEETYTLEGYTLTPHETWTTGCVRGWAEGDTVPFRAVVENVEVGEHYEADIWFDYYRVHAKGIEDLTNGAKQTIDGHPERMIAENCTVDSVAFQGYEWAQAVLKGKYIVWYTAEGEDVILEWRDLLAVTTPDTPGGSYWPGASLDTRFAWRGPPSGERTVPIMAVWGPGWEPGSICGGKFYDANMNGLWDEGERGLEGWLIELWDETGTYWMESAYTDALGGYCFRDLAPATYLVREVIPEPPPRWIPTTPTDTLVTLESGQNVIGIDFGNVEAIEPGDFTTYTQGGWGAECQGQNPGCYRDANFDDCFPNGLTVGCEDEYTALLTSSEAIQAFLPAAGTPAAFTQNHQDPTTPPGTEAGVLAGQVVALTLNVGFDLCDPDFGASDINLKDLIVIDPESPFYGWTVEEVLEEANKVLGTCSTAHTPSEVNEAATAINENFVDGEVVGTFLGLP